MIRVLLAVTIFCAGTYALACHRNSCSTKSINYEPAKRFYEKVIKITKQTINKISYSDSGIARK